MDKTTKKLELDLLHICKIDKLTEATDECDFTTNICRIH